MKVVESQQKCHLLDLFDVVLQRQGLLAADLEQLLVVPLQQQLHRLPVLPLQAHLVIREIDRHDVKASRCFKAKRCTHTGDPSSVGL